MADDLLTKVAQGSLLAFSDAAERGLGTGAWVDALLLEGRALIAARVEDPALVAAFTAALDVLALPENRPTLVQATQGAFTVLVTRIGMGARGLAREEYLRNHASFDERHAMLRADMDEAVQAAEREMALLDGLEAIAVQVIARGGVAVATLLLSLL